MADTQILADATVSFRDPAGRLVLTGGRALRFVKNGSGSDLRLCLASSLTRSLVSEGSLVSAEIIEDSAELVVEHERIQWPSYPYEWPAEMLHAAAALTLDLAERLLAEGFGLKDATPYNILFRGSKPVFVDWLSFERREPGDPTWMACAQFIRTFLLPLFVSRRLNLPFQPLLLSSRDGLDPEMVYRWMPALRRLSPGAFSLVTMPAWLSAGKGNNDSAIYRQKLLTDPDKAAFILRSLLKRLRRMLASVEPRKETRSKWSGYMTGNNNYTGAQFEAKERFVADAIREMQPARVLDVGCNNGHFSVLAARNGAAEVVATDSDPAVAGQAWRTAAAENLNILPLVVDLTRPTPPTGWRNREGRSFLDRAAGSFDTVLFLAVLHHVLVNERVPLAEFLDLAAELTTDAVIIEFVAPEDSMFRTIVRGRDDLHRDLNAASFETACARHFRVIQSLRLPDSHRWLYWLRKRPC